MFTGIILEMGEILSMKKRSGGAVLSVQSNHVAPDAQIGDSISVNGVCLTVISKKGKEVSFDLSDETLQRSNLGSLKKGNKINLEPSLNPASKIGGHFVTGHIDTIGKIRSKTALGDMLKFEIEIPRDIADFLVEKGSVAVDGISLTVVDILSNSFTTVIIPHTAKITTLGVKGSGDTVNIEVDILGKYVAKFLKREQNKNSKLMKSLMNEGYLT